MKRVLSIAAILSGAAGAGFWALPAWADDAFPNYVLTGSIEPASIGSPNVAPYTPAEIRRAYGFDRATFNHGALPADGAGQTIAIVDAYHASTLMADLAAFDAQFGLAAPPSFKIVNQSGGSTFPAVDTSGKWGLESALDVQWAHVIAPQANIVLVEASSTSANDLLTAVDYARKLAGVSVVCMSWGMVEGSGSAATFGPYLSTPTGHAGVTLVASSGDAGAQVNWPAASKNVVAVGGTTLALNSSTGAWASETAWSGSGGGISADQSKPSYQNLLSTPSNTARTVPDVSFVADDKTGVYVKDSAGYLGSASWWQAGGTSLAAPLFAGLVAVADEGRVFNGLGVMDSTVNTLPLLYGLSAADFHDITSGSNGYLAGPGYDLVTGRGSPVADLMIGDLAVPEPASLGLVLVGVVGLLRRRRR